MGVNRATEAEPAADGCLQISSLARPSAQVLRRRYRSRSEPDLDLYGPDLRKPVASDSNNVRPNDLFAGQAVIMMCPRSDSHLTYAIDIVLTTKFAITADGAR